MCGFLGVSLFQILSNVTSKAGEAVKLHDWCKATEGRDANNTA